MISTAPRKTAAVAMLFALVVLPLVYVTVTRGAAPPPDPNSPTGTHGLIMVDKLGAHIRFFDPVSYKELSNFATDINPHEVGISPDHRTAYIPLYGDGVYGNNPHPLHSILVIDLNSRQIADTIDVSPYIAPHGVQIDAAGKVYVTCDLSRRLLIVNPDTRKVEAAIDTDGTGHWMAVLADGTKAYVANKTDRPFISVIDLHTRKIVTRIPMPNGTEGIAASPDGKHVVAMDHVKPEMVVIDTATDTIVDRVTLQGNTAGAYRVRYSVDGKKILTNNSMQQIVNVLDATNLHGPQHVLNVGKGPMGFAFAADGHTALVGNHGDGTVSVMDLNGDGRVLKTFKAGTGIETLAYY